MTNPPASIRRIGLGFAHFDAVDRVVGQRRYLPQVPIILDGLVAKATGGAMQTAEMKRRVQAGALPPEGGLRARIQQHTNKAMANSGDVGSRALRNLQGLHENLHARTGGELPLRTAKTLPTASGVPALVP